MLEIINIYNHGFVAISVIIACKKRGFFDLLAREKALFCEQMSEQLKANSGHFQVALRMLESLHWLSRNEQGKYSLTPEAVNYKAIPEDILELYLLPIESYLQGEQPALLRKWIEYSCQRWNIDNPLIADFLDGILVIPLLLALHKYNLFEEPERKPLFSSLSSPIQKDLIELFTNLGWIELKAGHLTFTQAGQFIKERALNTAVVASYTPMLSCMDDVLFGDFLAVFQKDDLGQESHIDRTLNVIGSGFQHQKYFTDLEESILSIFNRFSLEEQPKYIADMGCGDGTLLKRVWETIRFKSARGKAIEQYPLLLIGVDYNEASLTASAKTLADLPHIVLQGDIGQPEQMVEDLKARGIHDPENILHIRSFLDHDCPFISPQKTEQLEIRKHIPYQGVYVDRSGAFIPPYVMIQRLVEHLERWSSIVTKHGLIILEVHCLEPRIVYQFLNKSENLHIEYNLKTYPSKSTEPAVKNKFLSVKNCSNPSLIEETPNTKSQSIKNEALGDIVEECISQIMGSQYQAAYASSKKLVDMGLDSLDLLELQALLEKRLKVQLDSNFFWQYDTPNNIVSYFNKNINSAIPASAAPNPVSRA